MTDDLINAPPTSSYLSSSDFTTDWSIQNWTTDAKPLSPIPRVNSAQNIYISRNTTSPDHPTYLTLRANRLDDFISTAELESNQRNLFYASIRARMRIIPSSILNSASPSSSSHPETKNDTISPGIVAGLFTYTPSSSPFTVSESDIELLTSNRPSLIHYSNQPDYNPQTDSTIPGATTQSTLPHSKRYTQWLDHRLDWHDGVSRWYVDGELVLEKRVNVPREPGGLVLNLWGDAGRWSGAMDDDGEAGSVVVLGVQWVQMVFNVSGPAGGPGLEEEGGKEEEGDDDVNTKTESKSRSRSRYKRDVTTEPHSSSFNLFQRSRQEEETHAEEDDGAEENKKKGVCKTPCTVDDVAQVGFPERVVGSATTSPSSPPLASDPSSTPSPSSAAPSLTSRTRTAGRASTIALMLISLSLVSSLGMGMDMDMFSFGHSEVDIAVG